MAYGTMEKIQTVTVGAGGQAAIDFLNIPATYDDLYIVMSARSTGTNVNTQGFCYFTFNSLTTSFTSRRLIQDGTSVSSDSSGGRFAAYIPNSQATAGTFGTMVCYIPNYRSSNNKSYSTDQGMENNSSTNYLQGLVAGLWSNSSAITSISIGGVIDSTGTSANFAQHTTATLYGITRVPAGAKATGGVIYDDSSYWYHVFTSSGTFTPSQNITCDYMVVAGGGGSVREGGGGAGGTRSTVTTTGGLGQLESALSLTATTNYTVTIGAGGVGGASATNGSNSVFSTITSTGGGYGSQPGQAGGSGGGGGRSSSAGSRAGGAASPSGQGFSGGSGDATDNADAGGGGGGGAGAAGSNGSGQVGGAGGNGIWTAITNALSIGQLSSGNYYLGGGGGGGAGTTAGTGGLGGGANGVTSGNGNAGTANTGGGGSGTKTSVYPTSTGGAGGSGIVIVRYAK